MNRSLNSVEKSVRSVLSGPTAVFALLARALDDRAAQARRDLHGLIRRFRRIARRGDAAKKRSQDALRRKRWPATAVRQH